MILSMMKNAGFISLFFPLIVFGYALMLETTPSKKVMHFILIYTELLVFIKFIVQLEFWGAIFSPTMLLNIENSMVR